MAVRAFFSYSRHDRKTARKINVQLERYGFEPIKRLASPWDVIQSDPYLRPVHFCENHSAESLHDAIHVCATLSNAALLRQITVGDGHGSQAVRDYSSVRNSRVLDQRRH